VLMRDGMSRIGILELGSFLTPCSPGILFSIANLLIVVGLVGRNMYSFLQVGHAGTLDPLSTGFLIVCVGKATKLADRLDMLLNIFHLTV